MPETLETMGRDVDQLVDRTQKLVDQYHELNVDVTKVKSDVDGRLATFSQEIMRLADRIPEKMNEKMIQVTLTLDQLVRDVKQIGEDLKADYVSRTEFEVLKVEHDQIKKLMWGFIAMVLTAVAGGILALLFR
jgi:uncharacterized protein YoxC